MATSTIDELMVELKRKYTIAIVTHNPQQAMRVADKTAFMYFEQATRTGYMVEYRETKELFENPREQYTRQYLAGEFS